MSCCLWLQTLTVPFLLGLLRAGVTNELRHVRRKRLHLFVTLNRVSGQQCAQDLVPLARYARASSVTHAELLACTRAEARREQLHCGPETAQRCHLGRTPHLVISEKLLTRSGQEREKQKEGRDSIALSALSAVSLPSLRFRLMFARQLLPPSFHFSYPFLLLLFFLLSFLSFEDRRRICFFMRKNRPSSRSAGEAKNRERRPSLRHESGAIQDRHY